MASAVTETPIITAFEEREAGTHGTASQMAAHRVGIARQLLQANHGRQPRMGQRNLQRVGS